MTNPVNLNYNCREKKSCYIETNAMPFGLFDILLPKKESFTDVDGEIEKNNYYLRFEWKEGDIAVPQGQMDAIKRATLLRHPDKMDRAVDYILVWHLEGKPYLVKYVQEIRNGVAGKRVAADTMDIGRLILEWHKDKTGLKNAAYHEVWKQLVHNYWEMLRENEEDYQWYRQWIRFIKEVR